MANSEFHQVAGEDAVGAETEIVASEIEVKKRRVSPSFLPLLLGVLTLALNGYLLFRIPEYLFAKNLQGALAITLVLASSIVSAFLIAYAFGLGRSGAVSTFTAGVVLPLILAGVAVMATVAGIQQNIVAGERQAPRSCVDVIEQAHNIAKDNPRFRMPDRDRDEIRCSVNAAIGR